MSNQQITGSGKSAPMTQADASRIQSAAAKSGADAGKNSFPARAQSAGAKNSGGGKK